MMITLIEDRLGNVIARPVNSRIARRFARDIERNGGNNPDAELFIQQPTPGEIAECFGRRALYCGEVNDGATIRVDAWAFRHMLGYCNA